MPDRVAAVERIMEAFGSRTGLTSSAPPRRYLWTDAFAVCAYLSLYRRTGESHWLEDARALVEQVHGVLGRHRGDDGRQGWISGLNEADGALRPTAGGLRIGKPLPERPPEEPLDERLEWQRDGQYYHYLTRWMHALARFAEDAGDAAALRHAAELAAAAHAGFTHPVGSSRRLYWKMSIDLRRTQVPSTGQHDAIDGLVATAAVEARLRSLPTRSSGPAPPDLAPALRDLAALCRGGGWTTTDALGIGGLLLDAWALANLPRDLDAVHPELLPRLLGDVARSLDLVATGRYMTGPAAGRIAFRELGLSLGLSAVHRLHEHAATAGLPGGRAARDALEAVAHHVHLRDRIEEFWLQPSNQQVDSWREHEDINAVMLATSLLPGGWLG